MSVVRDFILMVVKVKQCSKRSHKYQFKSSEVKQRIEHSQRIHFNISESKNSVVSVVSEEKQRSECSQ